MSSQGPLEPLAALVDASQRIVCFTGAGISTESGIPDFRSPGSGLWTKMQPIPFDEFLASEAVRTESWRRRFEGPGTIEGAEPNRGHRAIARLVAQGRCSHVITQNVDGLHQQSGIPADQVIELHGNATYARCLDCTVRVELETLRGQFLQTGRVAPCDACGGIIKSATISFGQAMPAGPMAAAEAAIGNCDLIVVAGSSLAVYPAAAFPERAVTLGAKLVIINREATPLDGLADLVVHAELGATLGFVAQIN
ncbi:MAG: NAD-dependent deacetylase [Pseudomonadales bacterium]